MNSKIIASLLFNNNAHDAMQFYTTVFPGATITSESPVVVEATLLGVPFIAINGGSPDFKYNSAASFMVVCETKAEIDAIWTKLSQGGSVYMALSSYPWSEYYGWIGDKFGISWQLYYGKLDGVHHQAIVPTLMFAHTQQGKCEKALQFYQSVFKDFKSDGVMRYTDGPYKDQIMHTQFSIFDYVMAGMDSGVAQNFTFSETVSFSILCENQEEIDYYWDHLTKTGKEVQCGWCQDQFGVSWQIVPRDIGALVFTASNKEKAQAAFFKMKKIVIKDLVEA